MSASKAKTLLFEDDEPTKEPDEINPFSFKEFIRSKNQPPTARLHAEKRKSSALPKKAFSSALLLDECTVNPKGSDHCRNYQEPFFSDLIKLPSTQGEGNEDDEDECDEDDDWRGSYQPSAFEEAHNFELSAVSLNTSSDSFSSPSPGCSDVPESYASWLTSSSMVDEASESLNCSNVYGKEEDSMVEGALQPTWNRNGDQLREENEELKRQIKELLHLSKSEQIRVKRLTDELHKRIIKDQRETKALEDMVQSVEQHLQLMTNELQNCKAENERLRAGETVSLNSAKQNALLASEYLSKAAHSAEASIKLARVMLLHHMLKLSLMDAKTLSAKKERIQRQIEHLEKSLGSAAIDPDISSSETDDSDLESDNSSDEAVVPSNLNVEDLSAKKVKIQREIEELERTLGPAASSVDANVIDSNSEDEESDKDVDADGCLQIDMGNDAENDDDLGLPKDSETCLQINLVYQEVIEEKLLELERMLAENKELQNEILSQLSKPTAIVAESSSLPPLRLFVGNFLKPYFKDKITGVFEGVRNPEELKSFWQNYEHPSVNKEKWSEEEIEKLKEIAAKHRSTDWETIASELGLLLKAVAKYGAQDWYKIRLEVPGRNVSQCRDRYMECLSNEVKKGKWSPEEETKLIELTEKYGAGRWSKIAAELQNRTDGQCLRKWCNLTKQKESDEEDDDYTITSIDSWIPVVLRNTRTSSNVRSRCSVTSKVGANSAQPSQDPKSRAQPVSGTDLNDPVPERNIVVKNNWSGHSRFFDTISSAKAVEEKTKSDRRWHSTMVQSHCSTDQSQAKALTGKIQAMESDKNVETGGHKSLAERILLNRFEGNKTVMEKFRKPFLKPTKSDEEVEAGSGSANYKRDFILNQNLMLAVSPWVGNVYMQCSSGLWPNKRTRDVPAQSKLEPQEGEQRKIPASSRVRTVAQLLNERRKKQNTSEKEAAPDNEESRKQSTESDNKEKDSKKMKPQKPQEISSHTLPNPPFTLTKHPSSLVTSQTEQRSNLAQELQIQSVTASSSQISWIMTNQGVMPFIAVQSPCAVPPSGVINLNVPRPGSGPPVGGPAASRSPANPAARAVRPSAATTMAKFPPIFPLGIFAAPPSVPLCAVPGSLPTVVHHLAVDSNTSVTPSTLSPTPFTIKDVKQHNSNPSSNEVPPCYNVVSPHLPKAQQLTVIPFARPIIQAVSIPHVIPSHQGTIQLGPRTEQPALQSSSLNIVATTPKVCPSTTPKVCPSTTPKVCQSTSHNTASPKKRTVLDLSLLFFEEDAATKDWMKGLGGVQLPDLSFALPYLPPSVCNLKTLSQLLEKKSILESRASALISDEVQNPRAKIQAIRKVVKETLGDNPAYLLLKARFLSCFTLPAFLATIPPVCTTLDISKPSRRHRRRKNTDFQVVYFKKGSQKGRGQPAPFSMSEVPHERLGIKLKEVAVQGDVCRIGSDTGSRGSEARPIPGLQGMSDEERLEELSLKEMKRRPD
ncbi:SDCG3 protein, partial [Polypterus senegalus]